jgi:hypothetical protein
MLLLIKKKKLVCCWILVPNYAFVKLAKSSEPIS